MGSIVYGSARKSYIRLLDPIHHQGLRLSLGVFRTSPAQGLYIEANGPSLENRRLKLSLQYTIKLKTNPLTKVSFILISSRYMSLSPCLFGPLVSGSDPIFRAWGSNWTTWPLTTFQTFLRGSSSDLTSSSSLPRRGSLTHLP